MDGKLFCMKKLIIETWYLENEQEGIDYINGATNFVINNKTSEN